MNDTPSNYTPVSPWTPSAKKTLAAASRIARELNVNYVDSSHLMLACLSAPSDSSLLLIRALGLDEEALAARIAFMISKKPS